MTTYRVVARRRDGERVIFDAASIYEAEYIRDEFQRGEYVDPCDYTDVTVEVFCAKHGWVCSDGGVCIHCLDAYWGELEAAEEASLFLQQEMDSAAL